MLVYPSLFVDKISLTLPIESGRRQDIEQNLNESTEQWANFISLAHLHSRYRDQFNFTLPTGATALLQFNPYNRHNNYLKLEYSPDRFGAEGRSFLGQYLRGLLGHGYLNEMQSAKINRLDLAFDVRRQHLNNLLIVDRRNNKSAIIRSNISGVESYYFPFQGTNQLCVYDKFIESTDGSPPPFRQWVRFEYRYRKISRYTLGDIAERLVNPFNRFEVKTFQAIDGDVPHHIQRMFFDACRLKGPDTALTDIDEPHSRSIFGDLYQRFPTPYFWLRRTSIWTGLREAIQQAAPH